MHGQIVYGHQEVLDPRYMGEGSETGAFKEGNNGYYIDDLDAILLFRTFIICPVIIGLIKRILEIGTLRHPTTACWDGPDLENLVSKLGGSHSGLLRRCYQYLILSPSPQYQVMF